MATIPLIRGTTINEDNAVVETAINIKLQCDYLSVEKCIEIAKGFIQKQRYYTGFHMPSEERVCHLPSRDDKDANVLINKEAKDYKEQFYDCIELCLSSDDKLLALFQERFPRK